MATPGSGGTAASKSARRRGKGARWPRAARRQRHKPLKESCSGCLPADQSCFALTAGAPYSTRCDVAAARAYCTTTSYIVTLGISFGSLLTILFVRRGARDGQAAVRGWQRGSLARRGRMWLPLRQATRRGRLRAVAIFDTPAGSSSHSR
ncbi:hypothetical protein ACP70R_018266 [Stipagrostis hirtigluma subsp. patula]